MPTNKPDLERLGTEEQNPISAELDAKPALEIARIINAEDAKVAAAVQVALPKIAEAIDAVAQAIGNGGRLIYVGAGTSGRIAALDASECPPTFNTDPETVDFVMAGGVKALYTAVEGEEDDAELGRHDIGKKKPARGDVVAGLTASGRTQYTVAAVEYAKTRGARTVGITCNRNSALGQLADIEIVAEVGPEVLSGSSRMKAGTAQKMICNMITTGAMARLGYVYGNLMVNVHLKNEKLIERGIGVLQQAIRVQRKLAEEALQAAGNRVPVAMLMLQRKLSRAAAEKRLQAAKGNVRKALGR